MFRSINQTTGEEMERYERHSDGEAERRLARTWSDWERWRRTPFTDRADLPSWKSTMTPKP